MRTIWIMAGLALSLWGAGRAGAAHAPWYYVDFAEVAERNGLTVRSDGAHVIGDHPFVQLKLANNSRYVTCNGIGVFMNVAVQRRGAKWLISAADAATVIPVLLTPDGVLGSVRYGVVVLDAGHGGDDNGAPGPGRVTEKKLTLDLVKRVRDKLCAAGVAVQLTRDHDRTLDLAERPLRAAKCGADLFVSIHLNSSADHTVQGVETYVVPAAGFPTTGQPETAPRKVDLNGVPGNRFDAANLALAYWLQKGVLCCTGAEDRGVKRARYYVLRNAPCPAALVECGFLSHRREGVRLLDEGYRDQIAEGVARGILTYVTRAREASLAALTALHAAPSAPALAHAAPR